ncbi:MAG: DNA recombination protein RmuC [Microbacteriaceae bacterium]|nr:DNA recombination protein RmuC [Microbacteriaceae bacterium]
MELWLIALIAAVAGLAVGALLAGLLGARAAATRLREALAQAEAGAIADRENALALAASRHETAIAEERALAARAATEVQADLAAAQASVDALKRQVEAATAQYRELVDRGERDAKERQAQQAAESAIIKELAPVKETLLTMQRKVTDLEEQRQRQHGEIAQQLKAATEGEERLRQTAESLAAALKNNVIRGAWGETQLRTLVESAGLLPHVDFSEQATIRTEDATRRPDMVVNLPGGKQMAVDAKVPYNDFIEAARIPVSATGDDEVRRKDLLRAHAKRVRAHVDALSGKGYWSGLEASPDFTIAFIPNEALLGAAVEGDPDLMDYALSKGVVLASPVSLWAVLKTVAFTWRQDVLTEDAKRLFDLSRDLYGRLATLADHAESLRKSIDGTVASYNRFASSLESRVLVTARKLGDLDESKVLPPATLIEKRPQALTAPELAAALIEAETAAVTSSGGGDADVIDAELEEFELRAE